MPNGDGLNGWFEVLPWHVSYVYGGFPRGGDDQIITHVVPTGVKVFEEETDRAKGGIVTGIFVDEGWGFVIIANEVPHAEGFGFVVVFFDVAFVESGDEANSST